MQLIRKRPRTSYAGKPIEGDFETYEEAAAIAKHMDCVVLIGWGSVEVPAGTKVVAYADGCQPAFQEDLEEWKRNLREDDLILPSGTILKGVIEAGSTKWLGPRYPELLVQVGIGQFIIWNISDETIVTSSPTR